MKNSLLGLLFLFLSLPSWSGHLMGGEITWECQGSGDYVFQLKVYRDCSGPALNTAGQQLLVWNHPGLTTIPLNFISQTDISPTCTAVAGGPSQLSCATSSSGSVAEYLFQSNAINIQGVPPTSGWVFTWDDFSRNLNIDNLQTPGSFGLTIRSYMYEHNSLNSFPCFDSSPQFAISPPTIACTGEAISFNYTAYDPDMDSLVFSFAEPLTDITTIFNPPATPAVIPYVSGYSFTNPTPDATFNASNIPASINSQTGEVNFTSFTAGNFVIVVKVDSYKNGLLVSSIYRDLQIAVVNCGNNNPPLVTPPFNGNTSFSTSVIAGTNVSFTLNVSDMELLQDGSPQTVTLSATGDQFGTGFTNAAAGCLNAPCATLNTNLPISGSQGVTADFNWQTDCAHLGANGSSYTYNFVFKATDDFCQVPGETSPVISITVLPPPPVSAPEVKCANVALNGDIILTWSQPADPNNSFVAYEIYEAGSNTLIATENNYNILSYTHIGADGQNGSRSYYVATRSGCNGMLLDTSNVISSMFLTVSNPGNGTAILQWNALSTPNISTSTGYYEIYQEYPLGTWTEIDSVAYGTNLYSDTIMICGDTLNYKIIATDSSGCISESSIDGENFINIIAPNPPIISYVSVDTTSGDAIINWNVNGHGDTEGYIILQLVNGNWVIIDTVYGINNTTYTNTNSAANSLSEIYSVAAFDSCYSGNPATPNTSAAGIEHNTVFLSTNLNICAQEVNVFWNSYSNWSGGVASYDLYVSENGAPFTLLNSGTGTSYTHSNVNRNSTYCYVVISNSVNGGYTSSSNKTCRFIYEPDRPNFHYLQVATVNSDGSVDLRLHSDLAAATGQFRFERAEDPSGPFDVIGYGLPVSDPFSFNDATAETDVRSYYYRAITIDTCGDDVMTSNTARTIYLTVSVDNLLSRNTIIWNKYEGWDGSIIEYRIYRSINGVFDPTPIATTPASVRFYEDDVSNFLETTGEFCYYVEAIETVNSFGINEVSASNVGCGTQVPLIYVPNAMIAGGVNDIFKPVISYADFDSYELKIFNRWGELQFSTNDIHTGWDGRDNGRPLKEGVYVWVISIRDGFGNFVEKRGHVTLLYAGNN